MASFYLIVTQFGVITPYSINILDSGDKIYSIESFTDCPGAVAFSNIKKIEEWKLSLSKMCCLQIWEILASLLMERWGPEKFHEVILNKIFWSLSATAV